MEYQTPKSKCNICNGEYTQRGMSRHIKTCLTKFIKNKEYNNPKRLLHICIYPEGIHDYFLHLLTTPTTTLKDLDQYLRDIWLECCGHLSGFTHKRWGREIPMSRKIKDVLNIGDSIHYDYDFGSTTELTVSALGSYMGANKGHKKIELLSKNARPIVPCDECNKYPAIQICTECQYDDAGWLCKKCSKSHECDEEMFLPVVNSPRAGVCGYTGDIEY